MTLGRVSDAGFCNFSRNLTAKLWNAKNGSSKGNSLVDSQRTLWPSRSAVGFSLRASASAQTEAVVADKVSETERTTTVSVFCH